MLLRLIGLGGLCAGAVLGALVLSGCGSRGEIPVSAAVAPPVAECVTVRRQSAPAAVELPGAVVPVRSVTLTAPLAGQVQVLAEEGARVGPGAEVAVLEPPGLAKQESAARAALDAAERRKAGTRTGVRQAETENSLAVSTLEQTLKAAEAERDRRKALLDAAELQAQTEPARLQAQVLGAEARVRLLKSGERAQRIRQLEAGLQVARAELANAKTLLKRSRDLYAKGYVSRADLDSSILTVQRAEANETAHEEELTLQKEGQHPEAIAEAEQQAEMARQALRAAQALANQVIERKADLAAAEAEAARAARNLENARSNRLAVVRAGEEAAVSDAEARRARMEYLEARERLAQSRVRAPFSGQVVRRRARPGETVTPGSPLLELVDPIGLQFEATVSEAEVARLHAGDRLQVSVPAVTPAALSGRVAQIILAADRMQHGYRVKIALERAVGLRPGMLGTARLTRPSAVARFSLPVSTLRRYFPAESRAELLVLEGDVPAVREVRTGTSQGEQVEIVSGLRDGDRVIVSDPGGTVPGQRVQVREVERP